MNKNRGRPIKTGPPVPPAGSRLTPIKCLGVVSANEGSGGFQVWKCQCSCGEIHIALRNRIQNGTKKSCGCLRREMGKGKIEKARAAHVEAARVRREQHAATK